MKKILLSCAAVGFFLPQLSVSQIQDQETLSDASTRFDMNQRYKRWEQGLDFTTVTTQELNKVGRILQPLKKNSSQFCAKAGDLCRSIIGGKVGFIETFLSDDPTTRFVIQTLNSKYKELSELTVGLLANIDDFLKQQKDGTFTKDGFVEEMRVWFQNIEAGFWSNDDAWIYASWNDEVNHPFRLVGFAVKAWPALLSQVDEVVLHLKQSSSRTVQDPEGNSMMMPLYTLSDAQKVVASVLGISAVVLNNALPCSSDSDECIKKVQDAVKKEQEKVRAIGYNPDTGCSQQANECQENADFYKTQLKDKDRAITDKDSALRLKDQEINALKNQQSKEGYVSPPTKPQVHNTTTAGKGVVTSGVAHGIEQMTSSVLSSFLLTHKRLLQLVNEVDQQMSQNLLAPKQSLVGATEGHYEWMSDSFLGSGFRSLNGNRGLYSVSKGSFRYEGSSLLKSGVYYAVGAVEEAGYQLVNHPVEFGKEVALGAGKMVGKTTAVVAGEWCVSCLLTRYLNVTPACANVVAHGAGVGALALATGGISLVGLGVDAASYTLLGGWDDIKTCYSSVLSKKKTA